MNFNLDKKLNEQEIPSAQIHKGESFLKAEILNKMTLLANEVQTFDLYHFMSIEEVAERISKISRRRISMKDEGNDDNMHLLIDSIHEKAYRDINYLGYIDEISTFITRQMELQIKHKPSLNFEIRSQSYPEEHAHYQHFKRKMILVDQGIGGISSSSLGRLFSLAAYGTDLLFTTMQHETIHHYQRIREKNPFLRFLQIAKKGQNPSLKAIQEIQARLHDSILGMRDRSEKEIIDILIKSYGLPEVQKDNAKKAIDYIKKLYALNVSNRRIANLIKHCNGVDDLSLFENEVNKKMVEFNIDETNLKALVTIDDLQRLLVHLRSKKFAQEAIINLAMEEKTPM